MPSSMIHLLTARYFDPHAGTAFWVGSVAPDCVHGREAKDRTHFRDRPDRLAALRVLARSPEGRGEAGLGVLLHLYLDFRWDAGPLSDFAARCREPDWFTRYRHETALAGAWLFHHKAWARPLWEDMLACPPAAYAGAWSLEPAAVAAFLRRNFTWHLENDIGPSTVYPPEDVEAFARETAQGFRAWLDAKD